MKFLFIAGIGLFIVTIFSIGKSFEKFNIERNGQIVKMQIESLPKSCIGAKVSYFVAFSYNGNNYERKTRGDFCEKHHVGEIVEMKMLEGSKYILFPHESALFDLLSLVALGLFGLILSITQYKKMRNEK